MKFLKKIEEKWQRNWEKARIFEAVPDRSTKKLFVTFPYPYMNGPLHVGHAFTASRVDAYARFKRMQGYNVLFPWAWHWTGQPLLGASERVAEGDREFIRGLKEIDGVPEEQLDKFVDPLYMATFYTNEGRTAAKKMGFSIDWRREFNTTMFTYQRFIEWQYGNLRDLGYVTKGTHPVVWCPKDQSPTGDHDRQIGEGVTPEEYTLMKFRLDEDTFLPAATFRPETVYGVTNIWLNPDADYAEAQVNSEKWVISEQAADKLREQGRTVKVVRRFKGRHLIGKTFVNPLTKGRLLILPGWFVNPAQATGVVYSVPAHAPYDWLALNALREKPERLEEFGIDPQVLKKIKPISLIKVEGFGEYPASEIIEQLGVKDQNDPKADEATKQLYKREFHNGMLNENCGKYSGKLVRNIKEALVSDFKERGIADAMYDLPQPVVCRCMTPCIVKLLRDQWFLNYSDLEWKRKTKRALSKMNIYPETARQWFLTVIDWLKEWACARTTGFGTPLPWGKGWIIETLSDSTIYMAFYTISKQIGQYNIKPENLTKEVFDYVFRGKGKSEEVAARSGVYVRALEEMQKEFSYWYPVDLRVSAKELVPNHLTFFLFHHTALFPPRHWPRAMSVNGMLTNEGKPMHKSKGNFVTMKKAIEEYGADAVRCALLLGAEGMDDPDWIADNAGDAQAKLKSFYHFAKTAIESPKNEENTNMERWLMSALQRRCREVTENMEELKTRTALEVAIFEVWNDFRWYFRRKGNTRAKALDEALSIWIRLVAPFAPHMCEELWSKMRKQGFISLAPWPKPDDKHIDTTAEEQENLIRGIIEDTSSVLKATKIVPRRICYYVAGQWKWRVYLKVLDECARQEAKISDMMKTLLAEEEMKKHSKELANYVSRVLKLMSRMSKERQQALGKIGRFDEKAVLADAMDFLSERFEAKVKVFDEEDAERYDPKQRAAMSVPYHPAIYVE